MERPQPPHNLTVHSDMPHCGTNFCQRTVYPEVPDGDDLDFNKSNVIEAAKGLGDYTLLMYATRNFETFKKKN